MMDDVVLLIPAYNPDEKLVAFVETMRRDFRLIVLVDDGSVRGKSHFDSLRTHVTALLTHPANQGKGMALKTGLRWIATHLPHAETVVTADADGQHMPADVLRLAHAARTFPQGLTLGVRAFAGSVPLRSRFGNWWARVFFWMWTGLFVQDTQTGLRGIPRAFWQDLLTLSGARYEFEMQMLVRARTYPQRLQQIPIETVYHEGNTSSHFQPLRDTLRTQVALIRTRLGF